MLVAVGVVGRIAFGQLALASPTPVYGILIKVGLTETLAFVSGFAFGSALGFLTGGLIIVISDIFMIPGPWTPFIGAIIGIFGVGGGANRRLAANPSAVVLGASAAFLTVLSEFLQNAWFAWFFNMPLLAALAMGIPSMATAAANNVILFTAVAPRIIRLIQEATKRPLGLEGERRDSSQRL
jgi:uncharacterized membrane protein